MAARPLDDQDRTLIAAARDVITRLYAENRHHIGAAVRSRSGKIYAAVHLDTYVGRASVCAEAIAVGQAIAAGDGDIVAIASVRHPRPRETHRDVQIVSPCGICREMLADFAPSCAVIVPENGDAVAVEVRDLLPNKYVRKG